MSEISQLSTFEGGEAYVRFCSGIAMLQRPADWEAVHNKPYIPENFEAIITTAEHLIISGSRKFIEASFPDDVTTFTVARNIHERIAPIMHELLATTCEEQYDRLQEINSLFPVVRPAPFLEKTTFMFLARGDYKRIRFKTMLDDMVPAAGIEDSLRDRDLSSWPHGMKPSR